MYQTDEEIIKEIKLYCSDSIKESGSDPEQILFRAALVGVLNKISALEKTNSKAFRDCPDCEGFGFTSKKYGELNEIFICVRCNSTGKIKMIEE